MSKHRIVLTQDAYKEITDSRDWCKLKDYTGFVKWYEELLADNAYRKSLPVDAVELRNNDDNERPTRQDRRDRDR